MAEGGTISGCEIFGTGVHRGKEYTHADLADMARNFNRFSVGPKARLRVPGVIGHEETQEFLERSDLPAAAWTRRVGVKTAKCEDCKGSGQANGDRCERCLGTGKAGTLVADFGDVPKSVAKLINRKAYRKVSAEIYDEPPSGIPGQGKMLRRVAFLGGEIPQVKTLNDIPLVEEHRDKTPYHPVVTKFSEAYRRPRAGTWVVFGEVQPMDRDKMLEALAKHGADADVCKDCPDPVIAEMLRVLDSKTDAAQQTQETQAAPGMGDEIMPPTAAGKKAMWAQVDDSGNGRKKDGDYDDNEMQGEWHERMGEDEIPDPKDDNEKESMKTSALKFFDRARKMMEKCGYKMAEAGKFPENSAPDVADMADSMSYFQAIKPEGSGTAGSSGGGGSITDGNQIKFSEKDFRSLINVAKAELRKEFGGIKRQADDLAANTKRANIVKFCESMRDAGKILPAEMDAGDPKNPHPTIVDRLMRADARNAVHKFSEGGKEVTLSELDLQMREIEARPVLVRFADRIKGAGMGNQPSGEDLEVQKVEAHFERFSEDFAKHGTKKKDLVEGFKAARDRGAVKTAEDYILVN